METGNKGLLAPGLNRRELLKTSFAGMLGALPMLALGSNAMATTMSIPKADPFKVSFHNPHTGEVFDGTYRVGSKYLPEAFDEINVILRDFRTGDVFPIDPRTMDILYFLQQKIGKDQKFEILSGYRSPKTNAMLAKYSEGVATNSLHLTGQAVDIRMEGQSTRRLRDFAMSLHAGGVGYYPKSGFVHVDTGRVRSW